MNGSDVAHKPFLASGLEALCASTADAEEGERKITCARLLPPNLTKAIALMGQAG